MKIEQTPGIFTDSKSDKGYTTYEAFFTVGSFLMLPELYRDRNFRQFTEAWVRFGLAIDDVWDFGINRKVLSGNQIDYHQFPETVSDSCLTALQRSKTSMLTALEKLPKNLFAGKFAHENIRRFEEGLMLNEALALSIQFDKSIWTPSLVEAYRENDALIWAAMYSASRPRSRLTLPDSTLEAHSYGNDPKIGLSRLRDQYTLTLMQSGAEGNDALSLASHLLYVQYCMDKDDSLINFSYKTPAFSLFVHNDETVANRFRERALALNRGLFSPTMYFAKLFPFVYSFFSNTEHWRESIPGWTDVIKKVNKEIFETERTT